MLATKEVGFPSISNFSPRLVRKGLFSLRFSNFCLYHYFYSPHIKEKKKKDANQKVEKNMELKE